MLSLGCEDVIAFGSDFDGCDMIDELKGVHKMKGVYENLLKQGFDESVLNKIFYNNAKRFFDKNLK